jgi:peptidoglycan/LPS O-acetylase OafA/YrhL
VPASKPNLSANLDLLRAVAVGSVFVDHFAMAARHDGGFQMMGRYGVVLFFVHTSCVLMASMERMERSAPSGLRLTLAFWIRRFFRIYPLAILSVLVVAAFRIPSYVLNALVAYRWPGLEAFVSNLALAQNLTSSPNIVGPLWSLPLEVQMYVVLPFLYFAIRGGRYRSLGLWLLAPVPLVSFLWIENRQPFQILLFAPCFVAGVVAYDLTRSCERKIKLPSWVWPVGILALLAMFGPYDPAGFSEKYLRCWGLALSIGLLYPFVKEARVNWLYKCCHWIAERSYGIYLSHSVILWIVFDRMQLFPLWLRIPVLIAGVLGVPSLLYVGFERPLIQVGVNVAKRHLKSSRAEVAPAVT